MFCENCGRKLIRPQAAYCPYCGAKQNHAPVPENEMPVIQSVPAQPENPIGSTAAQESVLPGIEPVTAPSFEMETPLAEPVPVPVEETPEPETAPEPPAPVAEEPTFAEAAAPVEPVPAPAAEPEKPAEDEEEYTSTASAFSSFELEEIQRNLKRKLVPEPVFDKEKLAAELYNSLYENLYENLRENIKREVLKELEEERKDAGNANKKTGFFKRH